MYLFSPIWVYILLTWARCCSAIRARATIAAAWLTYRMDSCAFLLERHEPHGIPSPCGHSCMVCATVCLTILPSFSDITDVSTISHSFKTERSRTPLFNVAQYLRRRHYGPRIKSQKTTQMGKTKFGRVIRLCMTNLQNSFHILSQPLKCYLALG